ncbi:MAG: ABC transporter permease [Planctomycetes bacterium]|nr:ABC transporter permease [Planctomycetota bacterium]
MNLFWILRTIRLGMKNLLLHKLRSVLNMLGILFGVGSVIAMLAIGEGAKWEAQEMVKRLGPTTIILYSQKPVEVDESTTSTSRMVEYGLTFLDMDRIAETLPAVKVVVPVRKVSKEIWMRGVKYEANLFGTIPRYANVTNAQAVEGRWLASLDFEHSRPVCVLTYEMARQLFPIRSALGETVQFGDAVFTVVGVLERRRGGSSKGKSSADEPMGAYTPLSALRERFGDINIRQTPGSTDISRVEVHEAQIKAREIDDVIAVARNIRTMLEKTHEQGDYSVFVPLEELRLAEATARIWTIVLACVAGISLLVGGIGVMNVMLATVTERTREVGIRRALGATQQHILSQFLVESLVLTLAGGILGVAFGYLLPEVVKFFTDVKARTPLYALFLAPGISLLVGLLSGLYPAWKAAGMDPVEALRHE